MTLRKIFINLVITAVAVTAGSIVFTSCADDDESTNWNKYKDWREANTEWLNQQIALKGTDGNPLFTKVEPSYNPLGFVYMRHIGDVHTDNLVPLYTSYVTVRYTLHLYDGTRVDSAASFTTNLNSQSLITGWATAIQQMHVNDSVEVLMPYNVGYGSTGNTSIPPYSTLRFNIRLLDIPYYETRP